MKKYKGSVSTNRVGSEVTFEFEVEDNATDEEIDEIATECMWDYISIDYEEVESEEK